MLHFRIIGPTRVLGFLGRVLYELLRYRHTFTRLIRTDVRPVFTPHDPRDGLQGRRHGDHECETQGKPLRTNSIGRALPFYGLFSIAAACDRSNRPENFQSSSSNNDLGASRFGR